MTSAGSLSRSHAVSLDNLEDHVSDMEPVGFQDPC